ncbi:Z-ring formation inhibitor MciZ [Neobacillus mesonae]|nr:Z-ring formation inhibitor MciZ [Neobacillus mesonae]
MRSYKTNHALFFVGQADQIKSTLSQWISDYGPDTTIKDLIKSGQAVSPFIRKIKKQL